MSTVVATKPFTFVPLQIKIMLFSTYIIEFADVSYNSKLCNVLYILSTLPEYATIRGIHILINISNQYDYNYFKIIFQKIPMK